MSNEINITDAVKAAKKVADTVNALHAQREELKSQLKANEVETNELYQRPIANADAKRFIFDLIDKGAADFVEKAKWDVIFRAIAFPSRHDEVLQKTMAMEKPKPLNLATINQVMETDFSRASALLNNAPLGFFFGAEGSQLGGQSPLRFYFFFGDQIKAQVEKHFDALYPRYGHDENPEDSLADRKARISALELERRELTDGISALNGKLISLGYTK